MLEVVRLGLVHGLEPDLLVAVRADVSVVAGPGAAGAAGHARELEEVHAEEGGDEAGEERDGVGGIVCVEALEEDDGGDDGTGRETDVVHRVDAVA